MNLYSYCHNNPVMYVDPSGHEAVFFPVAKQKYKDYRSEGYTAIEAGLKTKYEKIKSEQGKKAANTYIKGQVKNLKNKGYEFSTQWKNNSSFFKRKKSLREQYMGKTPGKNARTGREVIARMKKEGKIDKYEKKFEYKGVWYSISVADMGHKVDAVKWWNRKGRFSGPKSKKVRNFMLSPYNYELQPYWINRSMGAKLGENYLPPV